MILIRILGQGMSKKTKKIVLEKSKRFIENKTYGNTPDDGIYDLPSADTFANILNIDGVVKSSIYT